MDSDIMKKEVIELIVLYVSMICISIGLGTIAGIIIQKALGV